MPFHSCDHLCNHYPRQSKVALQWGKGRDKGSPEEGLGEQISRKMWEISGMKEKKQMGMREGWAVSLFDYNTITSAELLLKPAPTTITVNYYIYIRIMLWSRSYRIKIKDKAESLKGIKKSLQNIAWELTKVPQVLLFEILTFSVSILFQIFPCWPFRGHLCNR